MSGIYTKAMQASDNVMLAADRKKRDSKRSANWADDLKFHPDDPFADERMMDRRRELDAQKLEREANFIGKWRIPRCS